jgi:hypothetical protein
MLAGVALAATLSANELIGAAAALAAVILTATHLVVLRTRPPSFGRALAVLALAAVPSAALLPTYATLLLAVHNTSGVKPIHGDIAIRDLLPFIYRDVPAFWFAIQLLALIVPAAVVLHRRSRMWPLVAAMVVATAILLAALRQTRFGYVAPVTATLALATWFDAMTSSTFLRFRVLSVALALGLVPLLAFQALDSVRWFRLQTAFYQVLPPDWVPVLDYLRADTREGSLVAVGPNDRLDPTGWWVQGYGERPALISSDPAWMNFPDERSRARQALWVFDPSVSAAESLRRARQAGADYLIVDKRWGHFAAWLGDGKGVDVVVDEPDVELVRV